MAERWTTVIVTALLVAVGGVAWAFQLGKDLEPRPESLSDLPREIQGWRAYDMPVEETVEQMLQADFNMQRTYVHPAGAVVWIYVGYYGTRRGGTPEHTPWSCYPAHGWDIVSRREIEVDPAQGLRANEIVVEREGEQRLVHFWYRSFRDTSTLR